MQPQDCLKQRVHAKGHQQQHDYWQHFPWSNIICGVYGMLVEGQTRWRSAIKLIFGLVGILFLRVLTVCSAISIERLGFAYVIISSLSCK